MSEKSIKSVLRGFKRCLYFAPLPVLSIVIYMGLLSTMIFPDGLPVATNHQPLWQGGYVGWYDFLLLSSVVASLALRSLKLSKVNLIFIWTLGLIILLSFINGLTLGSEVALDAVAYLLRFALAFSVSVWLVRCLGSKAVESLIIVLFIILSITALFVYSLQFNTSRIYASAMTIASFSQVAVVVSCIALIRGYKAILWMALFFLLLTFSKTSIALFLILLLVPFRKFKFLTILKYLVSILVFFVFVVLILLQIAPVQYTASFSFYTAPAYLLSWGGRIPIWAYALHLLQDGKIPLLGVGFNAASSLFTIDNITYVEQGVTYYHQHFHSILIEYGFGIGISAVFIFVVLLKRIWQTFKYNCNLPFLIFSFFLLCQSIDFTFYRPKEVIIWSLILGLAEGKWRFERG